MRLGVGIRAVFGQRGKDLLLLYSRVKPLGTTDVLWGLREGCSGGFGIVHAEKKKERKKEKKEWLRIYRNNREKVKRLIKAPDTARFVFVHDAFGIMD